MNIETKVTKTLLLPPDKTLERYLIRTTGPSTCFYFRAKT